MSISGRSAVGRPVRPSTTSAVMSCGASETRSSKMRRATTRPFSPQTATAVPSAATAIFERPAPAPARLPGVEVQDVRQQPEGGGAPVQPGGAHVGAARAGDGERDVAHAADRHVHARGRRAVGQGLRRRERRRPAVADARPHRPAADPGDRHAAALRGGHGRGVAVGQPGVHALGRGPAAVHQARHDDVRGALLAADVGQQPGAVARDVHVAHPQDLGRRAVDRLRADEAGGGGGRQGQDGEDRGRREGEQADAGCGGRDMRRVTSGGVGTTETAPGTGPGGRQQARPPAASRPVRGQRCDLASSQAGTMPSPRPREEGPGLLLGALRRPSRARAPSPAPAPQGRCPRRARPPRGRGEARRVRRRRRRPRCAPARCGRRGPPRRGGRAGRPGGRRRAGRARRGSRRWRRPPWASWP
jgi:hypothetical protein